ncbi:MAG: DUF3015 family protein [Nitrospiraceae bacterium]
MFSVTVAQAAGNPDNGSGCGVGKLAWMDYGGPKQIAPQVMMATTNGTFGISSGTSGCTNDGVVMKNKHVSLAAASFESLGQEMAKGQGERRFLSPFYRQAGPLLSLMITRVMTPFREPPGHFGKMSVRMDSLAQSQRVQTPVAAIYSP